ncbi:signal peptide-containing [Trichoderma arundinaceum]|uniref:Signal peptide-containing n=1 Tax=Trichoderma arundinaceum TaxID=490622 RepID=A0A395NII4_TRIAR|nr:signal peptide-containing [Trichoderma arundinaceum]
MAIDKTQTETKRISTPHITHLPDTDTSHPVIIEPYHVDLLPEYGYISREYLIRGIAAGESYCTRLLLRCPADTTRFSGLVVEEPSHLWGGTSIWRHINRWLMRNGHAWLEVDSQSPSAIGKIKNLNLERYKDMHFISAPLADQFMDTIPFMTDVTRKSLEQSYMAFKEKWWPATTQSPEIIAAASYALRSGQLGINATRVFLTGLSQTGGVTRRFITHSSHLRLPDGGLPFEGFIPCQSGGVALPDVRGTKVIELLGESEFQSVRLPCGVSGQIIGVSHRRADSNSFRLYEIAGMAHRESRYPSDIDIKRWSVAELNGAKWSTFPNSFIYHAVFDAMERWTSHEATIPPQSTTIQTIGLSDEIVRDEHGNALGGVRTLHTEVPLSRIIAATPKGRPNWYWGSEWLFGPEVLRRLYGTVSNYRRLAGLAIDKQTRAGFLLVEDAEILRRETVERIIF